MVSGMDKRKGKWVVINVDNNSVVLNWKELIYIKCLQLFGDACNSIKLRKSLLKRKGIVDGDYHLTRLGNIIATSIRDIDKVVL